MIEIYCDSEAGSGGNGTKGDPFQTLASAITILDANLTETNRLYITGVFRETLTLTGNFTDLLIANWEGQSNSDHVQIRGDVVLEFWTSIGGGVYNKSFSDFTPQGMVWDWDTNVDSSGHRHFGHLELGSFGSLATGEWAVSAGTLQIRLPDGSDPATHVMAALRPTTNGLSVFSIGHVVITDIDTILWTEDNVYGIRCRGSGSTPNKFTLHGCRAYDSAFHGIGLASAIGTDSSMSKCLVSGCREGDGTSFVIYSDHSGTVTGLRSYDCTCYMGGFYTDNLTTPMTTGAQTGTGAGAWFGHSGGSQNLQDYEVHRFRAIGDGIATGSALGFGGDTTVASDLEDGNTYPVRFFDCVATDVARGISNQVNTSYCAYFRCSFKGDLDIFGADVTAIHAGGTATGIYLECCEIIFDTGGSGDTRQIFRGTTANDVILINCSVSSRASGTGGPVHLATSGNMTAHGCIFHLSSSSTDDRYIAATVVIANWDHTDNWYNNIDPTTDGYATPAEIDTLDEWTDVVDQDGIYDVEPIFIDENLTLEPHPTSPILSTKKLLVWGTSRQGINHKPYDGSYGCYQHGGDDGGYAGLKLLGLVS